VRKKRDLVRVKSEAMFNYVTNGEEEERLMKTFRKGEEISKSTLLKQKRIFFLFYFGLFYCFNKEDMNFNLLLA
jgi:hypothetical protein